MQVLVTGGTGDVGRAAVRRLAGHGHGVRVIGRRAGMAVEGAEYRRCDITDFEALREQMEGMQAVVHLAAIRHPSMAPGQEMFRVNCGGAFNVYRAAADAGIKRIVSASSINALGYNFGIKNFKLRYFPMDEEHPSFTTDSYSFSKQIIEEIAAYFWRREGISGVCLRLPAVYEIAQGSESWLRDFVSKSMQAYRELMALPEGERQARVCQMIARFERFRTERTWEKPLEKYGMDLPDAGLMFGRSNFWTSIDDRDSAQAIEKGLLADYEGSHPLYVNDSHNFAGIESEMLARVFFREVEARKRPIQGTESLVSIDQARALIGFEPEFSIRDWFA
jgi:hypothetical protein